MAAMGGAENLVELPPERSEQLDWRPSTLLVIVHVRKKYARKVPLAESGLTLAEQNVAVARKPAEAIPGALAGPGLMSQVIVCKGTDHLPLHRLEGIFKRQGVRLSRQTMDGWWLQTAEFLRPLQELAIRVVLASHVVHTDDTSVRVRDAWRKEKHTGHFWPYVGDALHALTVFDYTPTHQRDGPAAFLEGLSRLLAGRRFQRLRRHLPGIARANRRGGLLGACAAEVPRVPAAGCGADGNGVGLDRQALRGGEGPARALPGRVANSRARGACRADRRRAAGAVAAVAGRASMPGWKRNRPRSCPRATVRGAMDYALNNWAALCVYTEDGWLDIDNNEGENSLARSVPGTEELALPRQRPRRPRRGNPFQLAGLLQAARPRSLGLLPRHSHPPAGHAFREPARKNFSPYFPTAGNPPDVPVPPPPPCGRRFLPKHKVASAAGYLAVGKVKDADGGIEVEETSQLVA